MPLPKPPTRPGAVLASIPTAVARPVKLEAAPARGRAPASPAVDAPQSAKAAGR